jgi:hypothetical protein
MTRDETARLLTMMRAQWQRTTIEDADAMLSAYHLGLADVSYQDGEIAVAACIRECTFFPVVAEIRERLPHTATAAAIGEGATRAPRSAYDCGYLERPATGPNARPMTPHEPRSWDLPGVPTLTEIVAREERRTPVPLEPLVIPEWLKAVGE